MTRRTRRRPGSEQAPVLAPLTVLVSSALLALSQLYLAITLAPVIGKVLGGDASAAPAALCTTSAVSDGVGFLFFGPLSAGCGRKPVLVPGMGALAVVTAG